MLVRKAYKFRIYPNQTQQAALAVQFGHARYVYNHFLQMRRDHYKATGEGLYYRQIAGLLTRLKRDPDHGWLKEADSQTLQQSLIDLECAYKNFFEGRSQHPRFKSRRNKQSIRYPQRVKIDLIANRSYLPKVGWVKTVFHRKIEGEIKNVTVSKSKSGKFYASYQIEVEMPEPIYTGALAGIDLGLSDFATLSDGIKIANPRHLIQAERRLRRVQKGLSRKQKNSRGWEKQRVLVARQAEKVANSRADFLHKLSRSLVAAHRMLAIEDLHVKGMVKNQRLAKHISDAAWGQFVRMLAYKGEWHGCDVVTVDRWYPSSKTCSTCGEVRGNLPLSVREWECLHCGSIHHRDINAAINILNQATAGTAECKAGEVHVRPVERSQAGAAKPEAQQLAAG